MKCLVTGGAGFIGSAIAQALLEQGNSVKVFDNLVNGFAENVPQGAQFIHEDLRDLNAVKAACPDVDVIFHQAAIRSVPKSVDDPFASNESNVTGTLNLLDCAAHAGVKRLIYASSSSVYGDTGGVANLETMAPNPQSPYAVSKLAGEHYCRVWTRLGWLPTVSLRYFNVFGPGQRPDSKYSAVFPAFISALSEDRAPEVHWDGEQSRDFTFIDDVVSANLAAASAGPKADGVVFNVGGGAPKTINEVLKAVSYAMGKSVDPVLRPRRSGDVRDTRADISLAQSLLSWNPRADWLDAVRQTVGWFVGRGSGPGP